MSTIHQAPPVPPAGPEPGPADDPFRYGWRYVKTVKPDGTVDYEQVPLTLEDLLFPEEGDFTVQLESHRRDWVFLNLVFNVQLADDPSSVVLADCRVDFNLPGVRPLGPDVVVIQGVKRHCDWATLDLAAEGRTLHLPLRWLRPIHVPTITASRKTSTSARAFSITSSSTRVRSRGGGRSHSEDSAGNPAVTSPWSPMNAVGSGFRRCASGSVRPKPITASGSPASMRRARKSASTKTSSEDRSKPRPRSKKLRPEPNWPMPRPSKPRPKSKRLQAKAEIRPRSHRPKSKKPRQAELRGHEAQAKPERPSYKAASAEARPRRKLRPARRWRIGFVHSKRNCAGRRGISRNRDTVGFAIRQSGIEVSTFARFPRLTVTRSRIPV